MLRPSVAVLRPSVAVLRPSVAVLCPGVAVLRPPAHPPNAPPSAPRSASANRAQGRFANFTALRVTSVRQRTGPPRGEHSKKGEGVNVPRPIHRHALTGRGGAVRRPRAASPPRRGVVGA